MLQEKMIGIGGLRFILCRPPAINLVALNNATLLLSFFYLLLHFD